MRFNKRIAAAVIGVMTAACLGACSAGQSGSSANADSGAETAKSEADKAEKDKSSGKVKTIRISHSQPETHPEHLACVEFKNIIEEKLGDKYKVEIYPNAVMGGSQAALEMMQSGSLEMVVAATSDLEAFNSDYLIFGLPYIFSSPEHFKTVLDNPDFMNEVYNSTTGSGIQGVSWFYAGTRSFYSKNPINSPADLKGKKIRVMSSETNVKMAEALGGAGVVMAYGEVYTGLQQGVIDVAESPQIALISHKHGEVAKYYSNDEHQIIPDMLVASTTFMNSIAPEDKTVFEDAFKECSQIERELWDEEEESVIAQAEEMGVTFLHVDKGPFEAILVPFTENIISESDSLQAKYDKIQELDK